MSETKTKTKSNIPKGKTALEALITSVAVIGALILLNVLTCASRSKLDLTEGNIYTLSDSSKRLVRDMPEKIRISAYFGNVPSEQQEKQTLVEMILQEYAESSGGKISYEKRDPWAQKELRDELKKDGITELKLRSVKDDKFEQVPMYFHVVFSHLDKKEIWTPSQGFALEGLEYDFSTRIRRLGYGKKKIGVTVGFGEPESIQVLSAPGADVMPGVKVGLGDLYDVTPVNWKEKADAVKDVDLLIVNGPTEKVSEAASWQLDQYLMSGKPVLFLVRGMTWQGGGNPQMQQIPELAQDQPFLGMPSDNGLLDQLAAYGFQVGKDAILDPVNTAYGWIPPGSRQGMQARVLFPLARPPTAGDKGILAGIQVLAMPYPSTITVTATSSADAEVIPLLETSAASFPKRDATAITKELRIQPNKAEQRPYTVGVAAKLKLKSFFAGKEAPPGQTERLEESPVHTRLIVLSSPQIVADTTLSDVQMHRDLVYMNGFVAVHNMVDWLMEDTSLVAARSKRVERPIDNLETGTRDAIKYANVVGVPLLFILGGIVYWAVRTTRRRRFTL
jgi:ABC-2 type transport system permease protein